MSNPDLTALTPVELSAALTEATEDLHRLNREQERAAARQAAVQFEMDRRRLGLREPLAGWDGDS